MAAPAWRGVPPSDTVLQTALASPDGRRVAVLTAAGELVVWQLAPHRELARWIVPGPMPLHAHHGSFPVAFNDAGDLLAVGGMDGRVRVWRVDPLQEVASFVPLPPGLVRVRSDGDSMNYSGVWTVEALAFAPGRPLLAAGGSDGLLKVWDVRSSVAVDSAWMTDSAVVRWGWGSWRSIPRMGHSSSQRGMA